MVKNSKRQKVQISEIKNGKDYKYIPNFFWNIIDGDGYVNELTLSK